MTRANNVNLAHSRLKKQHQLMQRALAEHACLFCAKHLPRFHEKPILRSGRHWLVTDNKFPYKGTRHHVLLIARDHVEKPSQLGAGAWEEFGELTKWILEKRKIKGGSILMRFGDSDYTGATIAHLHAHVVSGGRRRKGAIPIEARISYT